MRPEEVPYNCRRQGCPGKSSRLNGYCNALCANLQKSLNWLGKTSQREGLTVEDVDGIAQEYEVLSDIGNRLSEWRGLVDKAAQRRNKTR